MSPLLAGIFGFFALFVLFALRLPVALSMALVGFVGFSYLRSLDSAFSMISFEAYTAFTNYYYGAVVMFIWMGYIAFHTGISRNLYSALHTMVGEIRGGLAMATTVACGAFGAICGSTLATTASMGAASLPEMDRYNYDKSLSTGTVTAGGILGTMIPPSIPAIVYGIYTEQSITKLFLALVMPGLVLLVAYLITIFIITFLNPDLGPPGPKTTLNEKVKALFGSGSLEITVIFVIVLGGLFAGWFTPTESGAIGSASVLLLSLVRRKFNVRALINSLQDATRTSAMVFLLVLGAEIFGTFIAASRIPTTMANWVGELPFHPAIIIGILFLLQGILGCIMDGIAVLLLSLPIVFPIATSLGFDPIWLGPLLVLIAGLGMITPPVGLSAYVVYGLNKEVPLTTIFRGVTPFVVAVIAVIVVLTIFPQIVLFLPNMSN